MYIHLIKNVLTSIRTLYSMNSIHTLKEKRLIKVRVNRNHLNQYSSNKSLFSLLTQYMPKKKKIF